jgi:ParB/RepB/Spo0J family partition protein
MQSEVKNLKVEELTSVRNIRTDLDVDEQFLNLIRQHGVIQPLEVYRQDGQWIVHNGHRRLLAAIKIKLKIVPVYVIAAPLSQESDIVRQFVVNTSQKPLGLLDRVRTCRKLKELGMKQVKIARSLGMSEADVSIALSVADASQNVQKAIEAGKLSPSAIEPLLTLPRAEQDALLPAAINVRTVLKVKALVKAEKHRTALAEKRVRIVDEDEAGDPVMQMVMDALAEANRQLKIAESMMATIPDSRAMRPTVKELVSAATRLEKQLA